MRIRLAPALRTPTGCAEPRTKACAPSRGRACIATVPGRVAVGLPRLPPRLKAELRTKACAPREPTDDELAGRTAPAAPARARSAGPALMGGACRRRFGRGPPDVAEICGLHERNRDTASLFAVDRRCDFPIACGCRVFYFICPAGSAATYLVGPACPNHAPAGGVAVTGPLGCNVALVAPHSRRMPYSPDSRPPPPTNVQF